MTTTSRVALPTKEAAKDRPPTIICPSMLSSDFARLAEESRRMVDLGADWLHLDVMVSSKEDACAIRMEAGMHEHFT